MRKNRLFLCLLILICCYNCGGACSSIKGEAVRNILDDFTKENNNSFRLIGIDHFGRSFGSITSIKKGRQVGIFYWPWIGQPYASGIYDATEIAAMPNGIRILTDEKYYNPQVSPINQAHYWGKPLWGYYNSDDEWVIRKQLQLLTHAGIDFLFFDTTNAIIYENVVIKVLSVIDEMQQDGWTPPLVAFFTHSHSFQTVRSLYDAIYRPKKFANTWYRINGKPLIIAYTNVQDDLDEAKSRNDTNYQPGILSQEIRDFFYFLKPQWPSDPIFPEGFPWVEWTYPQPYHTSSKIMNVTVASHPRVPMSFSLTHTNWVNWGRGWNPSLQKNIATDVDRGSFFQKQWDYAISVAPPIISVGGWNEWIAYKIPYMGEYMLCDAASKEFSRDIEPMSGGYQDAFYLQLISNIRRYKGVFNEDKEKNQSHSIDIKGNPSQWDKVDFIEHNIAKRYIERNAFGGSKTVHYTQKIPTNQLAEIRVANDAETIFFYIKGKVAFSGIGREANAINILIGVGEPTLKGWEGYEYIVGKSINGNKASLDRLSKNFKAEREAEVEFICKGDLIQIAIPRDLLGHTSFKSFYFKVASGVEKSYDIMNYYQTGSVMPIGRLSYKYVMSN